MVIATWGRGLHVLPALRSVSAQTEASFECLLVGDADASGAEAAIPALGDPRFRWINLDRRWGTQAGPNSRGIAEARGRVVAFLGHDDLWSPDHLAVLLARHARGGAGVVASGVALYDVDADRPTRVAHRFPEDGGAEAEAHAMLLPSGLGVDAGLAKRVGPWRGRDEIPGHPDREWLRRCFAAGGRLRGTGRVTAHKFSALARPASYIAPDSTEQARVLDAVLARHAAGGAPEWEASVLAGATPLAAGPRAGSAPRAKAPTPRERDRRRGIGLALEPLGEGAEVPTPDGPASGWILRHAGSAMRWTGRASRADYVVARTGGAAVGVMPVHLPERLRPEDVAVAVNGAPVPVVAVRAASDDPDLVPRPTHALRFAVALRADAPSLVTLIQPPDALRSVREGAPPAGLAAGPIRLVPAP